MPPETAVDRLLFEAARFSSSELHLETASRDGIARARIDGLLHDIARFPKESQARLIERLKRLSRLRESAPLSSQTGELRRSVDGQEIEGRVVIVPTLEGEKALLRLRTESPGFAFLGLSEGSAFKIKSAARARTGLVLCAGLRDSGITTTLQAIAEMPELSRRDTVAVGEFENDMLGVTQTQADAALGRSYAVCVREALVRKPDALVIGDLRDEATAALALEAARGRFVIAGIAAQDATAALLRLLDLRIEPVRAAHVVSLVVAQRLVRRVCPDCRRNDTMTASRARAAGWPRELIRSLFADRHAFNLVRGGKCVSCRYTGYRGRIAMFELLEMSEPVRRLLGRRAPYAELAAEAVRQGAQPLWVDGVRHVLAGETTVEELLRV